MANRLVGGIVIAAVLTGCVTGGEELPSVSVEPTPSPTAEPTPTPTPSPSPSPPPSPTPIAMPVVAEFRQGDQDLTVVISNPNETVGLVRSAYQMTAFAADGSIVAVFGDEGLPGSPNTTIYRLPPGGKYVLSPQVTSELPGSIDRLEVVPTDDWIEWESAEIPEVTISNTTLTDTGNGASLTGQVAVDETEGIYNIQVYGLVDGPLGVTMLNGTVDCMSGPAPRAFEATSFTFPPDPGPYTLREVFAYTTTTPDVGPNPPPGCE